MSLEHLSYLAQLVGSVGVVVSLIFVGLQVKHNTCALQRNEHNSTMAQWTVIRMAIDARGGEQGHTRFVATR